MLLFYQMNNQLYRLSSIYALLKCQICEHPINLFQIYRQATNINRTLVGNKIVNHSDVVGASHVGTAQTTPSFST